MPGHESTIRAGGAEIRVEAFGSAADPAVLLIMGIAASMLWWEEGFCELLADRELHVLRYDHRDTGLSTSYEPGVTPPYGFGELVADAAAVIAAEATDGRAHVVGLSMGGGIAQLLALDHPDRVASLTLISTSSVGPGDDGLPGMDPDYVNYLTSAPERDWADPDSIIDGVVGEWRALWGSGAPFDEPRIRALAEADVKRAANPASAQNHSLMQGDEVTIRARLGSLSVPALVIQGR